MACIYVLSNLAVYEGLQLLFHQQELTAEVSVTHIK
jgi:hypothetical protein